MDTGRRPTIPKGSHPIEDISLPYTIPTPAICDLYDTILDWLRMRVTGGIIYGLQRLGKTWAIEYTFNELNENYKGKFQCYLIPQIKSQRPSETSFFGHWLKWVGHAMHASGSAPNKRQRLVQFLYEAGERTRERRVVVFLDEAQRLDISELEWLVDLRNELELNKVYLTVFLVGQPGLRDLRSSFELSGNMQIVGRFMAQEFKFYGLRRSEDVATCLNGYDEAVEYPEGSGWSFTRYYFPEAFDNGWRLSMEADSLWDAFEEVRKGHRIAVVNEIPMEHFALTVEYLLVEYSSLSSEFSGFSIEQCRKAVKMSGYVGGSRYLVFPAPEGEG